MARILLVEDNELNRGMLSRRLSRRGHQVLEAADGEAALFLRLLISGALHPPRITCFPSSWRVRAKRLNSQQTADGKQPRIAMLRAINPALISVERGTRFPLLRSSPCATFSRMGEQNVNTGPRYSGPIGILRPRDVLVFSCSACGREAKIAMREFRGRVGPSLWLEEIGPPPEEWRVR